MDVFWRKGYEATTLVDLTDATGLNKASLYRVFGDKHRLFMSALGNYAETEFQKTRAVISESASPLENIRAVVRRFCEDSGTDNGCMMINSMVELAPHDPEVKAFLQGFGERRFAAIEGMIREAQAAGEVRPELDPAELALGLMVTLAGSAAMIKGFLPFDALVGNINTLIESWT